MSILMPILVSLPKENFERFLFLILPTIIVLDFSLRFFVKKNATIVIIPYLTLPIPRKTLILYMILSDLQRFWIWGCGLIYVGVLYYYGVLTSKNVILLLFFILLNNYFARLVQTVFGGFAVLVYPICLGFIVFLLLIANLLSIWVTISMIVFSLLTLVVLLFYVLNDNLYKELNRVAL
jgi:hypothetical protein